MNKLVCFILILFVCSCSSKEDKIAQTKSYFDVKGYFNNEIVRLGKKNQAVEKAVSINGAKEEQKITITNWKQELQSFLDADINKASWKGSFNLVKTGNLSTYTSQSDKIAVKKLEVKFDGKEVKSIKMFINNVNNLYTSQDSLSYFPDSLYQIKKTQHIKLLEAKNYEIIGRF
jgi:hypothetical protein